MNHLDLENTKHQKIAVDGCLTGWILSSIINRKLYLTYIESLSTLAHPKNRMFYIDIPIKLPREMSEYPRTSDKKAKNKLGRFHSSVFYAPLSSWLSQDYETINESCTRFSKPKISKQSYNIFTKISEIQNIKNKHQHFQEVHPELLIHTFFDQSKLSKKTYDGIQQRLTLINKLCKLTLTLSQIKDYLTELKKTFPQSVIKMDDLIDTISVSAIITAYPYLLNVKNEKILKEMEELYERFNLFRQS